MINVLLWFLGLIYAGLCVWIVLIVLIQEGKQGGMSAMGGGSQAPGAMTDTFGAGGAQKSLFNWTAWSAAIFLVLALVLTIVGNRRERIGGELNLGGAPIETVDTAPNVGADEPVGEVATPDPASVPVSE